uniref:Uncharacterized protein n=1 Tax=Vannella robusta TaxID=1487602 RepID=A0A7S4IQF3_9EUKA
MTRVENMKVVEILKEMIAFGHDYNWDGLRSFTPYPSFEWLFNILAYFYYNYPMMMVKYYPTVLYGTLKYSALASGLGFLYPISAPIFSLSYFVWFFGMGEDRFVNHYYMKGLIIFILSCTNAGKAWSVDALLIGLWNKLRGRPANYTGAKTCPRWNYWFLRFQVAVVFFFATSTKIQEDWLRGQPWKWYITTNYGRRPIVRWTLGFLLGSHPHAAYYYSIFISYGGIFYDGFIVPTLLYLTVRPIIWSKNYQSVFIAFIFFVTSTLFHTSNAYITQHIGQFPQMTWVLYTLFFQYNWPVLIIKWVCHMVQLFGLFPISASWEELNTDTPGKQESQTQNLEPKRLATKKKKKSKSRPQKAKEEDRSLTFMQWMVIIFIIAYAAIQIAVPTRHIWGTNKHRPQWNSAVQYFGWRMMMISSSVKTAELQINHPVSNRTMLTVPLNDFHMADSIATSIDNDWEIPRYTIAVANHIADTVEREKGERPLVYANVIASVNRRKPQSRFKSVDLAQIPTITSDEALAEEIPLTEEEWNEIPYPILYLIRTFNLPLYG